MRKLITLLLAFLPIITQAQDEVRIHNFILKNGEVFWQKTYEGIDSATCYRYFKEKPFIEQKECYITLANYSKRKTMSRAFVLNEPCTIYFSLQVKEDRYRITISNIIFESSTSFGMAIGGGAAVGKSNKTYNDLKFYAYNKKGKITFREGGTIPEQLDEALLLLFDATKNQNGEEKTEILNTDF